MSLPNADIPEETAAQRRIRERKEALTAVMLSPIWTDQRDGNAVAKEVGLKDRQGLASWLSRHGETELARQFHKV